MIMKKIFNLLIWPIFLAPFVYLVVVWPSLPSQVPMHFDLHGNPDRIGSKNELIIVLLIITVISMAISYL